VLFFCFNKKFREKNQVQLKLKRQVLMCHPAFKKIWNVRIVAFHSNPAMRRDFSFIATACRSEIAQKYSRG